MREVYPVEQLDQLRAATFTSPVRLAFDSPERGGPAVAAIRPIVSALGRVRLSATPAKLFVDVDPGAPEPPVIAFDTIARSDAEGLRRTLLSVLPQVDEIVVGVDGRSDEATLRVARAYADCVLVFEGADIGLDDEAWKANRIHFANARNLGRSRVQAPWTLVVDTDEYLIGTGDLREVVRNAGQRVAFGVPVRIEDFQQRDYHRLAFSSFRWSSESHNQLELPGFTDAMPVGDFAIVQDLSLRQQAEIDRRTLQRNGGIDELVKAADGGDLTARFHVAKHRLGDNNFPIADAVKLVEEYRLFAEPHGLLAHDRAWLAMGAAGRYYVREGNSEQAELWALRVLLDGPRAEAFCLLGDLAEDDGDLDRALVWYRCASVTPPSDQLAWGAALRLIPGRLAALERACASAEARAAALAAIASADQDDATPVVSA